MPKTTFVTCYYYHYYTGRCLAYSPPGATISMGLAEYCKDFLISFILGRDLVARLSIANLRKLRNELLGLIAR